MKFLADMNISVLTVEWLRSEGYEATHVREHGLQQAADDFILHKARSEGSILLTMDLDFGYLMAVSREQLPSVILFRLGNETSEVVNRRLSKGRLPNKVASIISDWCATHRQELRQNWQRAQRFEPLERIQGADRD